MVDKHLRHRRDDRPVVGVAGRPEAAPAARPPERPEPGQTQATALPGLLIRRPRGRPRGAKTQVLRHAGALGMHHFAFLRSWLLGLDLRDAWQRYLAFSELSADVRHIEHRRAALLRQVLDAARQVNLSLPAEQQISAQIALLAQPPRDAGSAPLPSLDEFIEAQGLDREFYSEAELLQEYRQFHHLDSPAEEAASGSGAADAPGAGASAAGSAQVRALNRIEALLAREPRADDRLDLWLSPALAALLRSAGIATLGALADTVRVYGRLWYRRANRLGARRTAHLVDWLAPQAERFGRPIPAEAREPVQRQRARLAAGLQRPESAPRFAIVPLERLAVPPSLSGRRPAPGRADGGSGQRPGAGDDLSALRAWLRTHEASPATHRAYAKEVERFYLWCLLARGKPLSRVDGNDCEAYERFLGDVPPDWINPSPAPRIDPAWRPFRGSLSASSARYALGVLRTMFDGLSAAGHLAGNPLRGPRLRSRAPVPTPTPAPTPALQRCFTEPEWGFLLGQLAADADPDPLARGQAEARRIELLLRMLAGTGLRLAEIAGATVADLRQVAVAGEIEPMTVIAVAGRKGDRPRELPVGLDVLALIQQHHADARRAAGPLAVLPCPLPIVCALGEPPRRWTAGRDGSVQLSAAPSPAVRALGRAGIYLTLKRFFRRASARASAVDGLSRERLVAASTHWLRHTFARRGAVAGVPVEALREALGHASLASTGLYLDTSGEPIVPALRRMQHDTGV